ncbi:MAG: YihY/virulence factor BrkB family protein [Candidatus Methylomirabilales bacterium]
MAKPNQITTRRGPSFFREIVQAFRADDCTLLAAAISFYALLSIIPLVFLGVAFVGYIMGSSAGAVDRVITVIRELLPLPVVDRVEGLLHSVIATRTVASILALLSLLWVANGAFETVERAINLIHRVQETRGYFHRKLVGFLIMVTSGTLLLLSFLISPLLLAVWFLTTDFLRHFQVFDPYIATLNVKPAVLWHYVALPIPFLLMCVVFLLIYLVAPARAVPFGSAILGALIASLLWQIAKELYSYYLLHYARYDQLYGPLGAVIGLVLWIYYTAVILLVGAEVAEVHARRKSRRYVMI